MEILDSYLKAVKLYLPNRQRNDIARELSENILSAIEEREMALGRMLTEAEQAKVLTQFGDPCAVARSYRSSEHRLAIGWEVIGPELFPAYLMLLGFNLAVTLVTTVIIALMLRVPVSVRMFAVPLMAQVAILTVIFTALNYFRNRFPKPWLFAPPGLGPWQPVARWASASGLMLWSATALWLLTMPHFPVLLFGSAAAGLQLSPAWLPFYAPILLLLAAGIVQRSINLAHPEWSWLVPVSRATVNGIGLALQYPMIKSLPWVMVAEGAKDPARYNHLAQQFNGMIQWGLFSWLWIFLLINGAVYAWLCVPHIRRFLREWCGARREALRSQP